MDSSRRQRPTARTRLPCTLAVILGSIAAAAACANEHGSCSATDVLSDPIEPLALAGAKDKSASRFPITPATAAQQLQQQVHSQQLLLDVLGNVTSGTISAAAALDLLRDVAALRRSLKHGAAARRWAELRARSEQQLEPTQGILIVAGGREQFMNAYILLQLLRHPRIACELPVELVYYGSREYSHVVADAIRLHAEATRTTIVLVDGGSVHNTLELEPHPLSSHITGFRAKVHALTFVTSFDQVLLLDSDNTPLGDPAYLFNSQAFRKFGNVFWLDFWTNQWMKPVIYKVLGLQVPWEVDPGFRATEAGQIVIDRVQHYDVLEYLYLLNLHSNSGVPHNVQSVVGSCLWGDKDTYPIAFALAGKAHLVHNLQHKPMQALSKPGKRYVHAGMVHRGLDGELLFLHRTAAGKLWPHCALHGGATCVIFGVTTPVDQQQLVASVRDVTMMEFESSKVDLVWQERHCGSGSDRDLMVSSCRYGKEVIHQHEDQDDYLCKGIINGAELLAGADQEDNDHGTDELQFSPESVAGSEASRTTTKCNCSKETTLACDLGAAMGSLPIPVIAADRLPHQVQRMFNITYMLFLQSLQHI